MRPGKECPAGSHVKAVSIIKKQTDSAFKLVRGAPRRIPKLSPWSYPVPHLNLFKVGHRPLIIPAILLQAVYRKIDVQASLST